MDSLDLAFIASPDLFGKLVAEITSCSKCGKQLLTSRYTWSQLALICSQCKEDELDLLESSLCGPSDNQLNEEKSKVYLSDIDPSLIEEKRFSIEDQEIFITWPLLIKTLSRLAICLLILVSSGFGLVAIINQNSVNQNPSLIIDSVQDN